jgi:hypothetical protein
MVLVPDPDKVSVVLNLAVPTTASEVKSFLGMAGFYRDHVANFAEIVAPLNLLTHKKTVFV